MRLNVWPLDVAKYSQHLSDLDLDLWLKKISISQTMHFRPKFVCTKFGGGECWKNRQKYYGKVYGKKSKWRRIRPRQKFKKVDRPDLWNFLKIICAKSGVIAISSSIRKNANCDIFFAIMGNWYDGKFKNCYQAITNCSIKSTRRLSQHLVNCFNS